MIISEQLIRPKSNHRHLVVGDFNDYKNTAPIRRFLKVNKTTLHHMLPCRDTMGYFWTHYYNKQDSYDRLDYLFSSPAMFGHYIKGSARANDSMRLSGGVRSPHGLCGFRILIRV